MNVRFHIIIASVLLVLTSFSTKACIWDSDSLASEKKKSPKLAEVILGPAPSPADPAPLRARIQKLKASPHEDDPAWWNDLAGAHIRLGEPAEAVKLLEPVMAKFPNDYGMHANLGTAYHLLGRYKDAEREIARDLEINRVGHFGLEKYHLALLRYLSRDAEYQKKHVYVDVWTESFLEIAESLEGFKSDAYFFPRLELVDRRDRFAAKHSPTQTMQQALTSLKSKQPPELEDQELMEGLKVSMQDAESTLQWELSGDPKLEEGVLYMASLNPKQPACFTMLGIVCLKNRNADLHLAAVAFQKAIDLGSPQKDQLMNYITAINAHIQRAGPPIADAENGMLIAVILFLALCMCVFFLVRWFRSKRKKIG